MLTDHLSVQSHWERWHLRLEGGLTQLRSRVTCFCVWKGSEETAGAARAFLTTVAQSKGCSSSLMKDVRLITPSSL
eukprot:3467531-Amphidinium_carterae.2